MRPGTPVPLSVEPFASAGSSALSALSEGPVCAKPCADPALVTFWAPWPFWLCWVFFCCGFCPGRGAFGFWPGFGPSDARFSAASAFFSASSLSIFVKTRRCCISVQPLFASP